MTDVDLVMIDTCLSAMAVFWPDTEMYSWVTAPNVPQLLEELHDLLETAVFRYEGVTDDSRHWYRRVTP